MPMSLKKFMTNSSIALGKLIKCLNFSKLRVHIEKNGHRNWHIFLCQSLQNFNSMYLKMLYKVKLLTLITINLTIKLICIEYFLLIVVIPYGLAKKVLLIAFTSAFCQLRSHGSENAFFVKILHCK